MKRRPDPTPQPSRDTFGRRKPKAPGRLDFLFDGRAGTPPVPPPEAPAAEEPAPPAPVEEASSSVVAVGTADELVAVPDETLEEYVLIEMPATPSAVGSDSDMLLAEWAATLAPAAPPPPPMPAPRPAPVDPGPIRRGFKADWVWPWLGRS
jgi:hypothetical protein